MSKPDGYSVELTYKLGLQCQNTINNADDKIQYYLCAKLCFSLPKIQCHPQYDSNLVDHQKLFNLQQLQQKYKLKIDPNYQSKIPLIILNLLKSYYKPWLIKVKPMLKERSAKHIEKRKTEFIKIFEQVIGDICNYSLNVDSVMNHFLQEHHKYIDTQWCGPNFKDLKVKKTQTDCLTVLYNFDGYKKRCNNSQEEFFKKYEGKSIAFFISEVKKLDIAEKYAKIKFILQLLQTQIKFPMSKKTDLIPNSWIFNYQQNELLKNLTTFIGVNQSEFKGNSSIKQKRKKLIGVFQKQIDKNVDKPHENDIEMKDNNSFNIPPPISPDLQSNDNDNGSCMIVNNYNNYGGNNNQTINYCQEREIHTLKMNNQHLQLEIDELKNDKQQLQQEIRKLQMDNHQLQQQLQRQIMQQCHSCGPYNPQPQPYHQPNMPNQYQQLPLQQPQQQQNNINNKHQQQNNINNNNNQQQHSYSHYNT